MTELNKQPLLSISIPTWNRAGLLNEALECLESQIGEYKDDIEIIISDNASTDETPQVINSFIERNPKFKIISCRQKVNTGYFGNFKNVRELSTGKYLWILSDDDHVQSGVISLVLKEIKDNQNISAVFLDIWDMNPFMKNLPFVKGKYSWDYIFRNKGYKITLISSVIFINIKKNDKYLLKKYNKNTFLGFLFLLSSYDSAKKVIVIRGISMITSRGKTSFNVFDSFIEDLTKCFDYWDLIGISGTNKKRFINSYLKSVLSNNYLNTKLNGKYDEKPGNLLKIESRMKEYYKSYINYWIFINTFHNMPKEFIKVWQFFRKVFRLVFVRTLNIK